MSGNRYRLVIVFEAEDDADALRQEDEAYESFDSVIDNYVETEDGRRLP